VSEDGGYVSQFGGSWVASSSRGSGSEGGGAGNRGSQGSERTGFLAVRYEDDYEGTAYRGVRNPGGYVAV
jgi:hypothetical protein